MNPETTAELRRAYEASIMLVTLLLEDNEELAADQVWRNPNEYRGPTCMAIATLAVSTIKTLAQFIDADPMELIKIAGISAAQTVVEYEQGDDSCA